MPSRIFAASSTGVSAPSSSHVSNATMLLPASLRSCSRVSAYSGSIFLIE